uniref:FAM193 C-terminal domain-containing protein n=1 Tax=Amblyomma aureolatum TaxID=187763 RepID=A0A1E1XDR9_9ACAR
MSPAETKKTKRRKNKKVARSTGKEQIEGVGMSAGVGSANPCIGQNAKDAGVLDLTLSASPACGPKEVQGCILCSRTHSSGSATDHTKDAVDIFGPEAVWDSLPSDALCSSDALFSEDIDLSSALRDGTFPKELLNLADDCGSSVCVCERYSNWKALEPEADQQELLCWQVVKQALHRKYQRAGLGSDAVPPLQDDQPLPTDAEVRAMVSRLRRRDPQHLLQCLKYQAQLFVVESRLRMLRQLVAGPRLEDALVAEYAKLRLAWEGLDPLLEELVTLDLNKYGLSWELVNKYLFQAIVYSDPEIHKCLTDLLTQRHSLKFKQDHKALLELDNDMTLTTIIWRKVQQLLDEPHQLEQVLPAQWMSPTWKPVDPDLVAKNLGHCCRSLLAGELQQEGCNSALEQRQCCLATASGIMCPFAETRPSVLALAAGEPSSTSPLSPSPVLPGAAWGHGGDTCGPGPDGQSAEASLPKKAAETCECHACTQMPWNPQSLLQLYGARPINLDLDALDSLPQLRDWEDGHFKSRHTSTDLSPQPAPPGTTSPQSSSTPARRHSEPGTCLDSDCDNALIDGEDSLDDSCSEHSSSTTASNQRSAGENRVCDCCYCEVFGHGAPPVAPVSKNYQEMRDRLRLILSKRKAEAIHMAKQRQQQQQQQQQHHHQERHEDDREVEELLSYINGTDSGSSRKESAHVTMDASVTSTTSSPGVKGTVTKRHKRKTKRREDLEKANKAIEIKVHSAPVISRLVEEDADESKVPSSPKAVVNRKEARKENGVRLSKCPKSNGTSTNGSSCIASIHELNEECPPPEVSLCNRVTSSTMISTLSNSRVPATSISGNVFIIGRPTLPSETGSMLDEETVSKMTIGDVELSVTSTALSSNNVLKKVRRDRQASMPEASSSCNHRQSSARDQLSEAKKQLCITHHLNGTQTASKNKKSRKKKNSSADVTSPDEVFLPKDIDLENGDLDELEREVEAFKRFCFNSVPVANKEKVHVNLKDILLRRKQTSTTVMPAGLLQRT